MNIYQKAKEQTFGQHLALRLTLTMPGFLAHSPASLLCQDDERPLDFLGPDMRFALEGGARRDCPDRENTWIEFHLDSVSPAAISFSRDYRVAY